MDCKYICPILTSFTESGEIAYDDMQVLYERLIKTGVNGVLVGGSAGEFYAMSEEELEKMVAHAVKVIDKKIEVIAGTGRLNHRDTISLSNKALAAGADAVILVGPYYSGVNQQDVLAYFDQVIGEIKGNIYIYNYPDRTGFDIEPATVLALLKKHKNIVGIKDTHPVLRHSQKYVVEVKREFPDFKVYTGYDNNCIPLALSGGDGCIGALSNLYPEQATAIMKALQAEDAKALIQYQRAIDKQFSFYEVHLPFNPVMKWAMNEMGLPMSEVCRSPIQPLTDAEKEALHDVAEELWRK